MIRILIVEDEEAIAQLVKLALTQAGYDCTCAYDGAAGADLVEAEPFDLVLLDVMLPQVDGYALLEYIRGFDIPVIFLTARAGVQERVRGLRAGADDYITKPFEIDELLARVESVLRRSRKLGRRLTIGEVVIDQTARQVTRAGVPVRLTAKEFDLLLLLARNPNQALTRSQIYWQVWGEDTLGDSRTVDLHVQRVRRKLGLEQQLRPVYKVGYRLEVDR